MIIGSNHDGPVHELLNNNPKERKVVDLCAGTGLWYVVHYPRYPTPVPAARTMYIGYVIALIMTIFQGLGDGQGIPPCGIPWTGSWCVLLF
jgi:hypothetical protein